MILGRFRVWSAELACRLHRSKSRWYWLAREIHLLMYWWGRSDTRWEHHLNRDKKRELAGENPAFSRFSRVYPCPLVQGTKLF